MKNILMLFSEIGIIFGSYFLMLLLLIFVMLLVISKKNKGLVLKREKKMLLFCTILSVSIFSVGLLLNYNYNLDVFFCKNFLKNSILTYGLMTVFFATVPSIKKLD